MGSAYTARRRRRILDQFHQLVAHHDFAGRRGHVAPDHELLGAARALCPRACARMSSSQLLKPRIRFSPASARVVSRSSGIGGEIVGRRQRLDGVARDEIERARALRRDAGNVRPGLLPPIDVIACSCVRRRLNGHCDQASPLNRASPSARAPLSLRRRPAARKTSCRPPWRAHPAGSASCLGGSLAMLRYQSHQALTYTSGAMPPVTAASCSRNARASSSGSADLSRAERMPALWDV